MRKILFLFFLLPIFVHADWDQLFCDDEDPSLFHHVNVISGHLSLCMQDAVVQGAIPFPLTRTYSSSGALERLARPLDLTLKRLRGGWMIQGGWNFLPHANLLIQRSIDKDDYKAFLPERCGNLVPYIVESREKNVLFLKPDPSFVKNSTTLSARTNIQNNLLEINLKTGEAKLSLPDGGYCTYSGKKLHKYDQGKDQRQHYFRLISEVSPSKSIINYSYDDEDRLVHIETTNPSGSKIYSWVHLDLIDTETPFHFKIKTSDEKNLSYQALEFKNRDYINDVKSNCRPYEKSHYSDARKSLGARMSSLELADKVQFNATYYMPPDKKTESKWADDTEKKDFETDKVHILEAPVGAHNEMLPIATFSYNNKYTDVRDVENILTRYHHESGKLTWVEYFDEKDQISSLLRFIWDGPRLRAKAFYDEKRQPLFAKTFKYDDLGNVTEEALWGNLTGLSPGPFSQREKGRLEGAESYRKHYTYLPHFNVPILEEEEDGLSYRYTYKPDTDLLTAKLTCDKDKIILREFLFYDEDNILIAEITDDGIASDPNNLTGVTERHIKRYEIHSPIGLPIAMHELYWDPNTHREVLLKKSRYGYGPQYRVILEEVYDANDAYRYTLYTDYNDQGRVVRQTSPLGQESRYTYDTQGNLLEAIEPGSPKKVFTYDVAGRPISCLEIDRDGNQKISHSHYDPKGRLLAQSDTKNNLTRQSYDPFGRCLATHFPPAEDDQGNIYTPSVHFTYDSQGNLASSTTPQGETAQTYYNTLRKPILIIQPDGSQVRHEYNKNGTLRKTTYPDSTTVEYTYDLFQRMTAKKVLSSTGDLLDVEYWTYNTFHLLSHLNAQGLTTAYTYDGAGRKITEDANGRTKTYTYDALGFIQTTTEGETSHTEIHDSAGRVIEEWTQDTAGRIENHMRFFYNNENHKEKALRITAQGESTDLFYYDPLGRLTAHIDPLGNTSHVLYNDFFLNSHDQYVLQKTTIDPIANRTLETYDATGRLCSIEKQNPDNQTVAYEEYCYDRSGNKTRRISTVYQNKQILKIITVAWQYDAMGRPIAEIEASKKITRFAYDIKGRLAAKTLPDYTVLAYTYDGLDRLTEQKSSDGSIHYQYHYSFGPSPTQIRDLINNTLLTRHYDPFGELLKETNPFGLTTEYHYDTHGRRTQLILPDHSTIDYTYSGAHLHTIQRKDYKHTYTHFDPNGHIAQETLLNNHTLTTTRDILERPTSQSSPTLIHTAAYNPSSLVTSTTNTLFGTTHYTYDALNQLIQENDQPHPFDSLGNPSNCTTNDCNQIVATPDFRLTYSHNGNPVQRISSQIDITYFYDALGRLTHITYPNKQKVRYIYDAFSRLIAKETFTPIPDDWHKQNRQLFLYDHDREIGACDIHGNITQLKVLGLGIKGDIGAAIALEIDNQTYAPLHDFNGNIIALTTPSGALAQSYHLTAFGTDTTPSPISPWRFCSKRTDTALVYFGQRFYDPTLKRWLTPDPSGFTDGPNLYTYVLNSPLNRLDLFGLSSEHFADPAASKKFVYEDFRIDVPISFIEKLPPNQPLHCMGIIKGVVINCIIVNGHLHKLVYTPEERRTGMVNIVAHFQDLMPKSGRAIGLITLQNGINTSLWEFSKMCKSVAKEIYEGTLVLGLYNPTKGLINDLGRVHRERKGFDPPFVKQTAQVLAQICSRLEKINPQLLQLHLMHSEAVLIGKNTEDYMTPDQKLLIQKHVYFMGFGGAEPMHKDYGYSAVNIYSKQDYVTKWSAKRYRNDPNYDIQFIPCSSSWSERSFYFADHGMLGTTYKIAFKDQSKRLRKNIGFNDGTTR